MNHRGTVMLETPRLILRRMTQNDTEAMYQNWASDARVTEFLTWPAHESPQMTRQILALWENEYANPNFYQWGIVLKDENVLIGTISVVRTEEEIDEAEIGYCIGYNWWHRGYTSEALFAVIRFLFTEVGANRIAARHDVHNPHSGDVMKKCGLRFEGIAREGAKNNQGLCDIVNYAILKKDYV